MFKINWFRVLFVSVASISLVLFYNFWKASLNIQVTDWNIPRFGTFEYSNNSIYDHTVRLISDDGICSGVVIDANYILTAAHCVTDSFLHIDPSITFEVYDVNGQNTFTAAKPVALSLERDIALLRGDFRQFKYSKVDFYGVDQITTGEPLAACGYPSGQKMMYCGKWRLNGSYSFKHTAKGDLTLPGMSGGPVFDRFGNVIGVVSAAMGEVYLIAPTLGLLSEWGIESGE